MVTCPVCKAVIKPCSMEYHDKKHALEKMREERNLKEEVEESPSEQNLKRRAALK